MKKSLVKLVAVSATAMSLATVVVPAANAQDGPKFPSENIQVDYDQLVIDAMNGAYGNPALTQDQVILLTTKLGQKAAEIKQQRDAKEAAIKEAEKTIEQTKKSCDVATSDFETAKVRFDNAKKELKRLNDLVEKARLDNQSYETEYLQRKLEIERTFDVNSENVTLKYDGIKAAEDNRLLDAQAAVASAEGAVQAAQAAYDNAAENLKADAQATLDEANVALQNAIAEREAAQTAVNNSTAMSQKESELRALRSEKDTALLNLSKEYVVEDGYKKVAKLEAYNSAITARDNYENGEFSVAKTDYENKKALKNTKCDQYDNEKNALTKLYEEFQSLNKKYYNLRNAIAAVTNTSIADTIVNDGTVDKDIKEIIKDVVDNGAGKDVEIIETTEESEESTEKSSTEKETDKGSKDGKKVEKKEDKKSDAKLPETGEASTYAIFGAAALSILAGLGLVAPKFSKED
ncbi:LPXTG-motif cell wall anchor domain-containing protein [Ignavigranum ruoffiae]|uniref:LPXTG-motif cell wall anchor domain-containing protein n=1 Tax=Ignavigranum ruoffiae TaxID=89093 RepID=A0A1H9GAQ4_9LACT|nr:LPXTG cell wall anchor domain-containing protein [Ignavigranum ruoffiae]SEQ47172.1 LPXTG-motif cell wall anchor domain-containing protein [Ignavigranum ruoffiae]